MDCGKKDKIDKKCTQLEIDGFKDRERPHKTWSGTVAEHLKAWNIDANNAHDQPVWKKALRTAMKSLTHRNCGQVAQNGCYSSCFQSILFNKLFHSLLSFTNVKRRFLYVVYFLWNSAFLWILVIDEISAHTYFLKRFIFIE